MEKYYTPDISDLAVGMIIEIHEQCTSKMIRKVEWHPVIIDASHNEMSEIVSFNRLPNLIKQNKVRVKYLDREDIESLGWKFDEKEHEYSNWNYFLSGQLQYQNIKIESEHDDITHDNYTCWRDVKFDGKIKNKSELRRLMQQLVITEPK